MREILFRGKDLRNGGKWAYGFYNHDHNRRGEDIHLIQPVDDTGHFTILAFVDPETVGQYTGLCDKNGERIFEGDMLQDAGGDLFHVYWSKDDCQYCKSTLDGGTPIETSFDWFDAGYAEVIGNIHDNPELLEVDANA